jgi:branched-chain amino acid transport system substrate-binding protein
LKGLVNFPKLFFVSYFRQRILSGQSIPHFFAKKSVVIQNYHLTQLHSYVFVTPDMKKQHFFLSLSLIDLLLVGAIAFWLPRQSGKKGAIKVGVILPLTGPSAHIGAWQKNGILLANAAKGEQIQLVFEDSAGTSTKGLSAYQKLVQFDKVDAVISSLSGVTNPLVTEATKNKIPLLMISVSYPGIAERSPFAFRFHPGSEDETFALMSNFKSLNNNETLGIAAINDDFGRGAVVAIEKSEIAKKIKPAAEYYEPNANDMKYLVEKILKEKPTCIYVIGYVDATAVLIRQIREAGYQGAVTCNMAMSTENYLKLVKDNFRNTTFCVTEFSLGKRTKTGDSFIEEYKKQHGGSPTIFAAMASDSLTFVAKALEKKGGNETLFDSMKRTTELSGAMGELQIDEHGNVKFPLSQGIYKNGEIVSK